MMASQNGHTGIVKLLLEKGANPNLQAYDGYSPLMLSSQNGYSEIVKLLLEKSASVDLQDTTQQNNRPYSSLYGGIH